MPLGSQQVQILIQTKIHLTTTPISLSTISIFVADLANGQSN